FTGSSAVGLGIVQAAAETPDAQRHVKRVVAEMGGKNCVIVDSDADLDEAVPAIVRSAFVYAGQKCSACARVLARDAAADALRDGIFGPVLAVERVPSVDAACEVLEQSPFALTGGLFSRNPAVVEEVTRRVPVGNLYVNRHITGAMVGRQPFGGNRRSGVGSKAGGPDYLLQFMEPHVVSENTMRHGLVVE